MSSQGVFALPILCPLRLMVTDGLLQRTTICSGPVKQARLAREYEKIPARVRVAPSRAEQLTSHLVSYSARYRAKRKETAPHALQEPNLQYLVRVLEGRNVRGTLGKLP